MANKSLTYYEDDEPRGLIPLAKALLLKPFNIIFSKTARRAYLTTLLVLLTALTLLALATTAYILFYWSYIPRIGFSRDIHLQFDSVYDQPQHVAPAYARRPSPYPYGHALLTPDIVGAQTYDVVVELVMPRTGDNVGAGNFMLEGTMYAASNSKVASHNTIMDTVKDGLATTLHPEGAKPLFTSRRPAILPYRSRLVDLAYRLTSLHWYLLNLRQETENLQIPLFDLLHIPKASNSVPATLKLEIQSTRPLQVYTARAHFRARFRGLRWVMYNHRIISFVVFVGLFWATEAVFAALAWAALTLVFSSAPGDVKAEEVHEVATRVKVEGEEEEGEEAGRMSDTERTFPATYGRQEVRYSSGEPRIKKEEEQEGEAMGMGGLSGSAALLSTPKAVEADDEDEDEDADFFLDSGLGTSMESSGVARRDSMRRRRGRQGGDERGFD